MSGVIRGSRKVFFSFCIDFFVDSVPRNSLTTVEPRYYIVQEQKELAFSTNNQQGQQDGSEAFTGTPAREQRFHRTNYLKNVSQRSNIDSSRCDSGQSREK